MWLTAIPITALLGTLQEAVVAVVVVALEQVMLPEVNKAKGNLSTLSWHQVVVDRLEEEMVRVIITCPPIIISHQEQITRVIKVH